MVYNGIQWYSMVYITMAYNYNKRKPNKLTNKLNLRYNKVYNGLFAYKL